MIFLSLAPFRLCVICLTPIGTWDPPPPPHNSLMVGI